jgi:hypothetical protein
VRACVRACVRERERETGYRSLESSYTGLIVPDKVSIEVTRNMPLLSANSQVSLTR